MLGLREESEQLKFMIPKIIQKLQRASKRNFGEQNRWLKNTLVWNLLKEFFTQLPTEFSPSSDLRWRK